MLLYPGTLVCGAIVSLGASYVAALIPASVVIVPVPFANTTSTPVE